jgi:hypothetical protein
MRRVTMKTLQHRVDMLNRMVHLSDKIWHNGKMVPDMFVLDAAYGGYRLCQIVNHEGESETLQVVQVPVKLMILSTLSSLASTLL